MMPNAFLEFLCINQTDNLCKMIWQRFATTGVKKDNLFTGDLSTLYKSGNTTVNVKIDTSSKVRKEILYQVKCSLSFEKYKWYYYGDDWRNPYLACAETAHVWDPGHLLGGATANNWTCLANKKGLVCSSGCPCITINGMKRINQQPVSIVHK